MNIDLLLTPSEPPGLEAGLVADDTFKSPVAGVMFDMMTGQITLELANTDSLELNIPIQESYGDYLFQLPFLHIGVIVGSQISDYRQVPLILTNDPFGGGHAGRLAGRPKKSVAAFETFMKRCVEGQPAHRADLGDEASASSIMGGMSAAVLQFAPHLARARALEASRHLRHDPAPNVPGMGPGGSRGGGVSRPQNPPRTKKSDDESDA